MAGMEVGVEEMDEGEGAEVDQENAEAEEGGLGVGILELEGTGLLTQDADPGGTTLVDTRNDFNKLFCLAMLWMVHHFRSEGERFTFNFYRHRAHLLLCHPGDALVILLSR